MKRSVTMKRSVILLIALVWMYSACEKPIVPNEVEEPETETPETPEGEENEGAGEEAPEEEPEEEKVYSSIAFFYDKWLASKSLKVVEPTV